MYIYCRFAEDSSVLTGAFNGRHKIRQQSLTIIAKTTTGAFEWCPQIQQNSWQAAAYLMSNAQYTRPTRLNYRQSWPIVYNFLCCWAIEFVTNDDIMTSLLKKLSISIKIHVVKPLYSVSKLSTESVGSRRELVAHCVHSADADATQLDSCVASAVCIGLNLP